MDTLRKWLNKPKADDKSLLARFYHADRALTAVASELDSFDGRAEPDRCSRLVSRLRQGQDKVLSITNLIMEELLGDERANRGFRAKFPEEVLQENLAGQLWFGAECLAAGSSIMNREVESSAMRPLAKAVTKTLDNVRNLLRDQCLRNNIPNSQTLRLDINDAATEQLYECLKIFDRLFAEFELRYVSAMVQVKSKQEYEMQELISVLFSETLQRSLKIGLLDQEQVDSFDPALMFSIPRLAIVTGLVIYPHGPLNMDMPADQLSEMFRPFRTILINIRDLLGTLTKEELFQLEKLLCTNEDMHLKKTVNSNNNNSNKASCDEVDDKKSNSDHDLVNSSKLIVDNNSNRNRASVPYSAMVDCMTSSTSTSASDSSVEWTDDDSNKDSKESLMTADCASGFLIPNTTLGNLLQPIEGPLTDNFIASDEEYIDAKLSEGQPSDNNNINLDSGISTELNRSLDSAENIQEINKNDDRSTTTTTIAPSKEYSPTNARINQDVPSCSKMDTTSDSSEESELQTISNTSKQTQGETMHHSHHHHHHHHSTRSDKTRRSTKGSSSHQHRHHRHHSKKRSRKHSLDTSSGDTSSSCSDGDPREVKLALRAAGRMKFKSTDVLLHRLFVCIAGVADQLQTNFAADLRQILRSVFLINTTPAQQEIDIPTKRKDSDLFEFRASEQDVIQESAGSNQSIYSAEEVNPELDNVFSDRATPLPHERGGSLESDVRNRNRSNISRSRSLGEDSSECMSTSQVRPNSLRERSASRDSESGSNTPGNSSSASNSPVGGRLTRSLGSSVPTYSQTPLQTERRRAQPSPSPPLRQSPPAWIPDEDAPRCMACTTPFTAFRRRHHCRNCGGVFCGGCSNSSAPLPKYGLNKAVRVCRDCYIREVGR